MKKAFSGSMILISAISMDLLTGMEFDLFVPSFPDLQHHFMISPFWVEALLSVNFIGYCLSLFFVGILADHYGRKPIILGGLILFLIGSMLCLYDRSFYFLLVGRFLQGTGIAAPAILSFLIIADYYPLKNQQFLLAMLNGALNIAAAVAPVIGSYLTLYFHWQSNFIALFLLGFIVTVMTLLCVPTYQPQKNRLQSNVIKLSLSGYLAIFRSRPLMLLIIDMLLIFSPYWIFVGMSPLLYIKELGVSLAHFGYYQGVLALIFAFGSILYGLIINAIDYDQKKMLKLAIKILAGGLLAVAWVTLGNSKNPLLITGALLIFVIGQIIPSTILYPLSLHLLPEVKAQVSALIQGGRLIFSAISLEIAGYFYDGSFQSIGVIIASLILAGMVGLFFIIHSAALMDAKNNS